MCSSACVCVRIRAFMCTWSSSPSYSSSSGFDLESALECCNCHEHVHLCWLHHLHLCSCVYTSLCLCLYLDPHVYSSSHWYWWFYLFSLAFVFALVLSFVLLLLVLLRALSLDLVCALVLPVVLVLTRLFAAPRCSHARKQHGAR